MKTELMKDFSVENKIEEVWDNFSALEKVVVCVPGATLTEKIDDKNYKGKVELKFGPIKAKYDVLIELLELNNEAHKMALKGMGSDVKGKGGAVMDMRAELKTTEDGTDVNVMMEVSITGMLAQFGSRLINDATNQVFEQFVKNFKSQLAGREVDNTLRTGSIVGGMVKGIFGKK